MDHHMGHNMDLLKFQFAFAWVWIFIGLVAGMILGLFFHNDEWLGGYFSWQRRMLRLGHISFFGTSFLNLAYLISLDYLNLNAVLHWVSILLIVGAITMPTICFLSAWQKPFRHLFFIPVVSLLGGIGLFLYQGVFP